MKDYGEEKAKRELEELLQIIPVKTKNQEFINDVNENILNHEYRLALEKVKRFLDEKEKEKKEKKPAKIEELDPDEIITETKKEIEESLRKVNLDPCDKKKVGKYSLGMKQRLGIAQAFMENPEILILDEPTNGLDESGVKLIRELLLDLKKRRKIIVIASHYQEDIDLLCDKVYVIQNGKICEKPHEKYWEV